MQFIAHTRLAPRVRARWPRIGSATFTGLTGRCTRTSMLRMAAGELGR